MDNITKALIVITVLTGLLLVITIIMAAIANKKKKAGAQPKHKEPKKRKGKKVTTVPPEETKDSEEEGSSTEIQPVAIDDPAEDSVLFPLFDQAAQFYSNELEGNTVLPFDTVAATNVFHDIEEKVGQHTFRVLNKFIFQTPSYQYKVYYIAFDNVIEDDVLVFAIYESSVGSYGLEVTCDYNELCESVLHVNA